MPKYPSFFRADDEIEPAEQGTPSPNEWFGPEKTKYRSSTTFSEDEEEGAEGWREFFHGPQPPDRGEPMKNEWLNRKDPATSLKFKDEAGDSRRLIFVLEQAAEVFEAEGHIDLAAECERLCELALSEE